MDARGNSSTGALPSRQVRRHHASTNARDVTEAILRHDGQAACDQFKALGRSDRQALPAFAGSP